MTPLKAMSLLTIGVLCLVFNTYSQHLLKQSKIPANIQSKVFQRIKSKNNAISSGLETKSARYLLKIARLESKMKKKLARKDSAAAERIFGDVAQRYLQLSGRISDASQHVERAGIKYIPHLDTLHTALKFLINANRSSISEIHSGTQINEVIKGITVLQEKFNQAGEINKLIQQRKTLLHEQLVKVGLTKEVNILKKQAYYYQAQVNKYRKILDHPSILENRLIETIKQTSAFKKFFSENAQLAGLFRLSDNLYTTPVLNLEGLQTREGIGLEMIQRYGSGPDIQQVMKESLAGAQSQLSQLKDKIRMAGGSGNDLEMPDFKPNHQKTKRMKDRIEFGANLQTVKANRYFPSTSDVGLSIGYRLNNRSIAGIGGSYKVGWGESIRKISVTHQGVGFRTFFDYKIKGGIWVSGGGELNYRQHFSDFDVLKDYNAWQKSALIGLSKKYQVGKKFKGNLQFMYDFLWKQQVVRGQPVIFRVGYTF